MDEKPLRCETPGRPYLIGKDATTMSALVFVPNCGLWTCPYCAEEKRQTWMLTAWAGASKLAAKGLEIQFVTITTRGGKGRTRERALLAVRTGWPKLRKRAQYYIPEFAYIMIPEQHKNGIVHAHIICTGDLSRRWWKDSAYQSGLGFQAYAKQMTDPVQASGYVSKYLGKEVHKAQWPRGFRRVRSSANWPRLDETQPPDRYDYEVFKSKGALWWSIYFLRDAGYTVTISEGVKDWL